MLFEFSNQILAAKLNLEKPKKEFVSSKIVTDSRKISKGDCFLALKGPNFNGHDFIDEALDRGASFVISEKNYPQDEKILGVNSTNECLSFLAKYQREKFEGKVVGITGSNGKTSTKLLLSSLLSNKFDPSQIYVSPGNWNNFYGLCFSLLELKKHHKFGIFEMGTNDFGEINELSSILQPEVGVITSIGKAHLEKLINLEGVAQEKSDIFKNVLLQGTCIFPDINAHLSEFHAKSHDKKIRSFFSDELNAKKSNSKCVEAILVSLGIENISFDQIYNLSKDVVVPSRTEQGYNSKGVLIIDDTYNANPDSFKEAFRVLDSTDKENKICVIGDMKELGKNFQQEMKKIIDEACERFDNVFLFNSKFELSKENVVKINIANAEEKIGSLLSKNTAILFKASRSVKMEDCMNIFK
ncbi:MAG: UDP-N-acetylmuramoyl-tripeptide--D-alanyl-D-alanine ligase [Gammaproteobacteria bacterium]